MRFATAMIAILLSLGLLSLGTPVQSEAAAKQAPAPKAKPVPAKEAPASQPVAPAAQPDPKAQPATAGKDAPPPPQDTWSASEIAAAQKVCKAILRKYHAVATPVPPIRHGRCGDPAPVRLTQIGKRPVDFTPAPTVNCRMVAALGKWIAQGLQPLAKKHLGARLRAISVMSSYACRNRYGRKKARLSEHAKANALDIGGFELDGAGEVRLLAHWGPTRKDLIARANAAKAAREIAKQSAPDAKGGPQVAPKAVPKSVASSAATPPPEGLQQKPAQRSSVGRGAAVVFAESFRQIILPPLPQRRPSLKERMRWAQLARRAKLRRTADERRRLEKYRARLNKFLYPSSKLGGPKAPVHATSGKSRKAKAGPDPTAFLKAAHRSACRFFGTVLGPEANEAHRNHFHVDLAPRRRTNFCQ